MPDPTAFYVTTTATLPEEVVVGDKSKDWKISLLEERVESRIIMTKGLSAKLRNLQANLAAAHRELAGLRSQLATWENAGRDLGAVITTRDATIQEQAETNFQQANTIMEQTRTIASLRTQLARAAAIEEAAREVVDSHDSTTLDGALVDSAKLADLSQMFASDPAPAKPKCPHCGAGIGPENLTYGGCGRWLGKPAVEPESRECAAKRYQDALNSQGEKLVEAYRKLREAEARLATIQTECQAIARQVPNAIGPIARVLALFSPKEAT